VGDFVGLLVEGRNVGADIGLFDGLSVGSDVGSLVGDPTGEAVLLTGIKISVGEEVIIDIGLCDGFAGASVEGFFEGNSDGEGDGPRLGWPLGCAVLGFKVGACDGEEVDGASLATGQATISARG
jgi:hypothetical protein